MVLFKALSFICYTMLKISVVSAGVKNVKNAWVSE